MKTAWPCVAPSASVLQLSAHSFSETHGILVHPEAHYAMLLGEGFTQLGVEVKHLRMDRVGEVDRPAKSALEEKTDLVGVFGSKEIPDGASRLAVGPIRGMKHDVDGVRHIHVQPSPRKSSSARRIRLDSKDLRSLTSLGLLSLKSVVHFWPNVRLGGTSGKLTRSASRPGFAHVQDDAGLSFRTHVSVKIQHPVSPREIRHGEGAAEIIVEVRIGRLEITCRRPIFQFPNPFRLAQLGVLERLEEFADGGRFDRFDLAIDDI